VVVTLSSCCPPWSASTTTNASGYFEFGGLTPGTFVVSAQGRSRTVTLAQCDSAVEVNLCPSAPPPTVPTVPATAVPTITVAPTPTTTVIPLPPGTRLPTESFLLLEVLDETDGIFYPGENVALRLTLYNGEAMRTLEDLVIEMTLDNHLEVLGAASKKGQISLSGQRFLLTNAVLAPTNDLVINLAAAVRADTPDGTTIELQGTARTNAGDVFDSNVLRIEVWGKGVVRPPAAGTPVGVVTPVLGGPEPPPATTPTAPDTPTPPLPPTSTGIPIVGAMLGSGVLLARQLRLRKAGRHEADQAPQ